jgi:hypothetical protein
MEQGVAILEEESYFWSWITEKTVEYHQKLIAGHQFSCNDFSFVLGYLCFDHE